MRRSRLGRHPQTGQEVFDYLTDVDKATHWNPPQWKFGSPAQGRSGWGVLGVCSEVLGTPIRILVEVTIFDPGHRTPQDHIRTLPSRSRCDTRSGG